MKTHMVNCPLSIAFVIFSTNSIIAMEATSFYETVLPEVQYIIGVKKIHQPIIEDLFKNLGKLCSHIFAFIYKN